MVLFRCSCGAAHAIEERFAGGTAQCEQCGQRVPIPQQSDEGVLLVYKSGEDEEGIPMARDQVERALITGALSSLDLIWHENTWYPLRDFMGEQEDDVAPPEPAEGDGEQKELEATIGALTPIHMTVTPEDEEPIPTAEPVERRRFRFLPFGRKSRAQRADGGTEREKKTPVQIVAQVLGVILILGIAFKFGFGPLISSARKMTSYVIVQNHEDIDYTAKLGWRALLGSSSYKAELSKQSVCSFEIDVGMPEKQTLTLIPVEEGKGEPFKVKVPLRPGLAVLVNLKAKGTYAVYDIGKAGSKQVGGELKKLVSQVSAAQAPTAAPQVAKAILAIGKESLVTTVKDPMFFSTEYNLPAIALFGEQVSKVDQSKPVLSWLPVFHLNFKDGYCNYARGEPKKIEGGVKFVSKTVKVSRSRVIKLNPKSPPNLELRGTNASPQLSMRLGSQTVEAEKRKFSGTWSYTAKRSGGKKPRWTSSWSFTGTAESGKYRVQVTVDAKGQERVKTQKAW